MRQRIMLLSIAGVLALTALAAFLVYIFAAPTTLRIAVGPVGSEDTRLVAAVLQTFAREKLPIRLRMVPTDGPTASAEALAAQKVDLAIVRSDGNVPPNAATVAILHRDVAVLLTTPDSGITTLSGLAGKRVGIARGFNLNSKLLTFVLERSGIDPTSVSLVRLRARDVRAAITEGRIDAVFAVAPTTSSLLSALQQDMTAADGRRPVVVPIADAEAIAQRNPLLEPFTLLRGTFGGSPPRPAENIPSLAVTHRLVADRQLKEALVGDLAKSLFEVRQAIAVDAPMGARIEQPDTEAPSPLVIHPGAAAYFDGEQSSFIEQYGEWLYLGVMGFGLLGSVGAALLGLLLGKGRPSGQSDLDRMLMFLRQARSETTLEGLDQLQREADESLMRMVERAARSEVDEPVMSAFTIALGEVRTALDDRRRALALEARDAPAQ